MSQRITLYVYVDLDREQETFSTEESALENLQGILYGRLTHYNPQVSYPTQEMRNATPPPRAGFIIQVNLACVGGMMNSKYAALKNIRRILEDAIGKNKPIVLQAPLRLPTNVKGKVKA